MQKIQEAVDAGQARETGRADQGAVTPDEEAGVGEAPDVRQALEAREVPERGVDHDADGPRRREGAEARETLERRIVCDHADT